MPAKTNPLVSVIVPIYNAAPWLADMLDSLKAQEYGNFEALLVNDGSTDDSADICRLRVGNDSRFIMLDKPNGGLSSARNHGLAHARGEWITCLDADDALQPNALRRYLETARDTGADIVVGGFEYSETKPPVPMPALPRIIAPRTAIKIGLHQSIRLNAAWGSLYRRDIFFPDGPRYREGRWYEDLDIFYRLFERASRIAYLPEKLYFYRRNPQSFINTISPGRFDVLDVTDEILAHYRGTDLERAARDRRFSAHYNMLVMMYANDYVDAARESRCLAVIRQERIAELFAPDVRVKNRLGAAASLLGTRFIKLLARHYR